MRKISLLVKIISCVCYLVDERARIYYIYIVQRKYIMKNKINTAKLEKKNVRNLTNNKSL